MNPDKYQELADRTLCSQEGAMRRIQQNPGSVQMLHSVIGMMGELGELASNLEKWLWYDQGFDMTNFKEELGDMNWYEAEALNAMEVKFSSILETNIKKLQKTKMASN